MTANKCPFDLVGPDLGLPEMAALLDMAAKLETDTPYQQAVRDLALSVQTRQDALVLRAIERFAGSNWHESWNKERCTITTAWHLPNRPTYVHVDGNLAAMWQYAEPTLDGDTCQLSMNLRYWEAPQ